MLIGIPVIVDLVFFSLIGFLTYLPDTGPVAVY